MALRHQKGQHQVTVNGRRILFTFLDMKNPAKSSMIPHKRYLSEIVQGQRWFEEGLLLDTLEKGVLFPVIHCTDIPNPNRPPILLLESTSINKDMRLQQGLFTEIRSFTPGTIGKSTGDSFTAWIFMGFKTIEDTFNDVLEDSWKDWTGARTVYMSLPDEFGLSRLSLYRRLSPPKGIDVFMYIMIAECDFVNANNKIKLLDYVQRLRVERMLGYLSVYKVSQKTPSTAHVINGLLSDAVDTGGEPGEDDTTI